MDVKENLRMQYDISTERTRKEYFTENKGGIEMDEKPRIVQGNCGKVAIVTENGHETIKKNLQLVQTMIPCFAHDEANIEEIVFHPFFPEFSLKKKDGTIKKYKYTLLDPQPV